MFLLSEGKDTAGIMGAKFIEVSSGIQHNVDELLVGIVKQIKFKEDGMLMKAAACQSDGGSSSNTRSGSNSALLLKRRASSPLRTLQIARDILARICIAKGPQNTQGSVTNLLVP